jgi:hypothetical protein
MRNSNKKIGPRSCVMTEVDETWIVLDEPDSPEIFGFARGNLGGYILEAYTQQTKTVTNEKPVSPAVGSAAWLIARHPIHAWVSTPP